MISTKNTCSFVKEVLKQIFPSRQCAFLVSNIRKMKICDIQITPLPCEDLGYIKMNQLRKRTIPACDVRMSTSQVPSVIIAGQYIFHKVFSKFLRQMFHVVYITFNLQNRVNERRSALFWKESPLFFETPYFGQVIDLC